MAVPELPPPTWVRKRDGRTVPFDADKICRSLFAATESCGRPDAFKARELADGVVHFLAGETEGRVPTTGDVAEVVAKVVREFREPELAVLFEEHARRKQLLQNGQHLGDDRRTAEGEFRFSADESPAGVRDGALRAYTLQAVYTRDLAAAHNDGLLTLGGLEAPCGLASSLLGPWRHTDDLIPRLAEAAHLSGQVIAIDGPEFVLAADLPPRSKRLSRGWAASAVETYLEKLDLGLRLTGRQAVLNVNLAQPPPWASESLAGPLFAGHEDRPESERLDSLTGAWSEAVARFDEWRARLRLDWHLGERDFAPELRERLLRLARAALAGAPLTFVFDRPRRPVFLAEGVERRHPAVLLAVGLHLPRLAGLVCDEVHEPQSRERLLDRLKSLARLALSAGLQKREFLRRHAHDHPALARGFLLDRARLLVAPLGLDSAVQTLTGGGLSSAEPALALGREILGRLLEVLRQEGRASALDVCLGAQTSIGWEHGRPPLPTLAPGPTCWCASAPVKSQLQTIGALHSAAEGGTGFVFLPAEPPASAEQIADWLRWAWQHTGAVRLRFLRAAPPHRQLTFPSA